MWQRIQTLYIGIATALVASLFFCTFATIIGPSGEEIHIAYHDKTSYLVFLIMLLTASICALFSYKMRFLQARVCTISALLLIGFQIWLGADYLRFRNEMVFSFTMIFPIVAAILEIMAARSAMVDEVTLQAVKSVRKIRRKK